MSDIEEIQHVLAQYALVHDRLDLDGFTSLFTEDGRYVSRNVTHQGRAAIRDFIGAVYARRPADHRMKHLYANAVIDVHNADTASVTSDFIAYERYAADGAWQINMIAQCVDTLVKRDGRWLFLERRIVPPLSH
jgi:uncharacterized protein (TIGR02246 family)